MDPKDLDCRVSWACSYKALCYPSETHWSDVVPSPSGLISTQSIPFLDAIDKNEGHRITHILYDYLLLLHQQMHTQGDTSAIKSRHSLVSGSPLYMDVACTHSSHTRSKARSAEVSANIFIENPDYINISTSQCCDYQKMQHDLMEVSKQDRKEAQTVSVDAGLSIVEST